MVDVDKNLSPFPFPCEGKGEKKERGEAPSLKYFPPLLKGEDTGGEVRGSTKTEQNCVRHIKR